MLTKNQKHIINSPKFKKHMNQLKSHHKPFQIVIPAATKDEVKIYTASINEIKLKDSKNESEEQKLLAKLMKWRIYSGIIQEPSVAENLINIDFIQNNFGELNLTDLEIAMNMAASGNLIIDKVKSDESFATFSPTYIGRILCAYIKHRKDAIRKIKTELQRQADKVIYEPTNSEKIESFRKLLVFAFTEVIKDNFHYDSGDIIYDFIKKNNLLNIDKKLQKEALEFSQKQLSIDISNKKKESGLKNVKLKEILKTFDVDSTKKSYARKYVVNHWIKSMIYPNHIKHTYKKMNQFLDTITIDNM